MNDVMTLILALAAGAGLGSLFFGGLWWTVRSGSTARRPWLWFTGSLIIRLGIVFTGFYLVSGGDWKRLLACLLGFLLARQAFIRLSRPKAPSLDKKEIHYENQPG